MHSSPNVLQPLDANAVSAKIKGKRRLELPSPALKSHTRKQRLEEAVTAREAQTRPISFNEFQRHMHDILASDMDIFDCSAQRAANAEALEQTILSLMNRLDQPAQMLLSPVTSSWSGRNIPTSGRVMDILRFKRVQLLQGMETSFQDLCDWILLVVKLQEDVSLHLIHHFSEQLGPRAQAAVRNILCSMPTGGFVDPISLYVALKKAQPNLFSGNAYDGRYLTALVDDFIEKDASIQSVPIYEVIQTDLTPTIRGMLAEWLLQVSLYGVQTLRTETYFLGMTLLDQYLALHQVSRSNFLLFGCAALYLACKFEELYLHRFLNFLVSQASGSFTCEKVLQTEKLIATALDFHLCPNTLMHMTSALVAEQDPPASKEQMDLLRYIISSVTIHTFYGQYYPSQIAATCVFISRIMCEVPTGDPGPQVRRLTHSVIAGISKNVVSSQVGEITFSLFAEKRFSEVSKLFCNPNSPAMKYLKSL